MEMLDRLYTMMSIKGLAKSLIFLCLVGFFGCQDKEQLKIGTSGVNGKVTINANYYLAPNGIKVSLTKEDDSSIKHVAVTDATGSFQFRDIDAGTYVIDAVKEGYRMGWIIDDGTVNPYDKYVELEDNKIKDLQVQMWGEGYGETDVFDLSITDINDKPLSRIGIPYGATTISFKIFNGTQKKHNWDLQYNRVYVTTGWDFEYVFTSFNITEGTLEPGDNVLLVGYVNPNIFSSQYSAIEGVLHFNDYGSGNNIFKDLAVYFE